MVEKVIIVVISLLAGCGEIPSLGSSISYVSCNNKIEIYIGGPQKLKLTSRHKKLTEVAGAPCCQYKTKSTAELPFCYLDSAQL